MTITLTSAELSAFSDMRVGLESVEDVVHRVFAPMIQKHSETRLQRLADEYRKLSPELQGEALAVLQEWKASKNLR